MSITQAEAPCWHLIHTDGPTKGEPFESDDGGSPHYSTKEEAQAAARDEEYVLEVRQFADTACFTVKCDRCDYVLDEDDSAIHHHPTRADALSVALGSAWTQLGDDLVCPACNGA